MTFEITSVKHFCSLIYTTKNDSEFLMGSNNSVIESEEDGLQEVAQKTSEEKEIIHEGLINVTV